MGIDVKVEDILSNVRKSVDSDMQNLSGGTTGRSRGTLMRGALREMRISMGTDTEPAVAPFVKQSSPKPEIPDLRSRIRQKMAAMEQDDRARSATVMPARGDFSGILSGPSLRNSDLRPSYATREMQDDLRFVPPRWAEPDPVHDDAESDPYAPNSDPYAHDYGYEQQPHQPALISPQTEAHAETAFRQLSDALLARATGNQNLEDMTRDMLRGMLTKWLDANLPTIVEELVREEIERVARRGR